MAQINVYTKDFTLTDSLTINGAVTAADRQLCFLGHRGNNAQFYAAHHGGTSLELWEIDSGQINLISTLVALAGNDKFQGVLHNRGVLYGLIRDTVAGQTKLRAYDPRTGGQNWTISPTTANFSGITYDKRTAWFLNKTAGNIQTRDIQGSSSTAIRAYSFSSTDCLSLTFDGFFFWFAENGGSKRILQAVRNNSAMSIVKASNINTLTNAFGIMTDGVFLYVWES